MLGCLEFVIWHITQLMVCVCVCVCVCARLRKLTLAAPSHISFQPNLRLRKCAYQFSHETQT